MTQILNLPAAPLEAFRSLVDSIADQGVFLVNGAGQILSWNSGASFITGYSQNEVLGKSLGSLFPALQVDRSRATVDLLPAGQNGLDSVRHNLRRKDGTFLAVEMRIAQLDGHRGHDTFGVTIRSVPEQTRTDAALAASVEHLQAAVDGTSDALFIKDRDGRYLLFNRAAAQFVGKPAAEVIGQDDTTLFDPAGAQLVMARDRHVMETGLTETKEEVLTAAGVTRTYLATKSPYRDREGRIAGVFGVSRDITQLKQAESELHQSESRFQAFINHIPMPTWIADQQGQLVLVNRAFAKIIGRSELDFTSRAEIFPPEIVAAHEASDRQVLASGRQLETNEAFINADGTVGEAFVVKFPIPGPGGEHLVGGVAVDITQQKLSERGWRESEERLRSILDHAPALVYLKDIAGRYLFVNRRAAEAFGIPQAQWIGKTSQQLLPAEMADAFAENDQQVVQCRTAREIEEVVTFPNGNRAIHLSVRFPLFAPGDSLYGVCGISSDITDRKSSEDAIRKSEARYRNFVDHATDSLLMHAEDGRILDVNQQACESLGYDRDELIGQMPSLFDDSFAAPEVAEKMSRLHAGDTIAFDTHFRRKDGTTFPVSLRIRPFTIADQRFALALARDITDRKAIEAELHANAERYRLALDAVELGTWKHDLASDVIWMDQRCQSHHGLTQPSIKGSRLFAMIHRDDLERVLAVSSSIQNPSSGCEVGVIDFRIIRADGVIRWLTVRTRVQYDANRAACVIGTTLDITEQRVAEQLLVSSERRFRELADAIPQIVWTATPRGDLDHLNARAVEYTGVAVKDLTGWSWEKVIHPDDLPATVADWTDVLQTQIPRDLEFRIRRTDGQYRWHVTRQVAGRDSHGVVTRWYGTCTDIEDRRRAEAALRASESSLANAQRIARLASWTWDVQTDTAQWSSGIYHLMGLAPSEVPSTLTSFLSFVNPQDRNRVLESINRALAGSAPYEVEYRVTHPTRGELVIYAVGEVDRDAAGRPERMSGTLLDVTTRKQAEHAIVWQHRVMEQMATGGPLAEVLEQIVHLIEDQVPGTLGSILLLDRSDNRLRLGCGPQLPAAYCQAINGCLIGPAVGSCGTAAYRGEEVIVADIASDPLWRNYRDLALSYELRSCWSVPIFSRTNSAAPKTTNDVVGTFAVYQRVTGAPDERSLGVLRAAAHLAGIALERDFAARALRESEERFRQIAAAIDHVFWMVSYPDMQILYVNSAFEAIWGRAADELYGNPDLWLEGIAAEDRQRVQELHGLWLLSPTTERFEVEYRVVRSDGAIRWLLDRGAAICDETGAVYRLTGVAQDITEKKNLESQFRQAQKMEAVGQLAGGIAHDFNNLLMVISGFSELLLEDSSYSGEQREAITAIQDAGQRAAQLTRQLLAFSRKQLLEPVKLDLNDLVRRAETMIRRLIPEDMTVTIQLEPQLPQIKADPTQIDQVLLNLVLNSRDAMSSGNQLWIQTESIERPNGLQYVRLSVADNGTGMSDEVKSRVFEPFFTTKRVGQGTGLGMAVVHGIISQSGGKISVESQSGIGTTVDVLLPVAETRAAAPTMVLQAVPELIGTETVLLAEDEPAVRRIIRRNLEQHGYTVLEAENGVAAVEVARRHPGVIHLLLTDIVMPRMGGRQLAEALLAMRPTLKVVYMSGYSDDQGLQRSLDNQTSVILQKPFAPESLTLKVRETLDRKPATGA